MSDEIKQRVKIEGVEEATAQLKKLSQGEKEVETATHGIGNASETVGNKTNILSRAFGSLTSNVFSMAAGFFSVTAAFSFIKQGLAEITEAAKRAAKAMADVGSATRGLSANVGGKRAQGLFGEITAISAESGFDVGGRTQLVEAASSLTDIQPNLSDAQILAQVRNLALLQRTTGLGGKGAVSVLNTLQERLNLSSDQSVDAAVTLLNSGLEGGTITDIVERSGATGGLDMLALMLAARQKGLNINNAGRSIPTLIAALNTRDESGSLAKSLTSIGITEGMSDVDKLAFLSAGLEAGSISTGQFQRAIGGAQNLRIVDPLIHTLRVGLLTGAKGELMDPNAAENALAAILENKYVRANERANTRELTKIVKDETSSFSTLGEIEEQESVDAHGNPIWYWMGRALSAMGSDRPSAALGPRTTPQSMQRENIQYITNVTNMYNTADPSVIDSGRRQE